MVAWYMKHLNDPAGDIPQMGKQAFREGAHQPKHLFLGRADGTFEDVAGRAGREITGERMSRGAAFADFDGDGRLDVAVINKNAPAQVLLNRMPTRGNWVILDLRAPPPNVFAIGALVWIRAGGRTWTRELHAGSSYLSSDEPMVHAGLGGAAWIDEVAVRWPGGDIETFRDLPVNRRLVLRKGQAADRPGPDALPGVPPDLARPQAATGDPGAAAPRPASARP
jgi:hypothetical protein